jgi:hypothetical protein
LSGSLTDIVSAPLLRVRHQSSGSIEQRYIFEVLLGEHLGLQYQTEAVPELPWVEIDCPGAGPGRTLRVGANLFLRPKGQWLTQAAMPDLPLNHVDLRASIPDWNLGAIPVLFPAAAEPKDGLADKGDLFLPLDIFGGAFFLLTRYEELVIKKRDKHRRFPSEESIGYKAGLLLRPLVDEYSHLLGLALSACFPGISCRRHEPRIRLSHDVDHPYQFFGKSAPQMAFAAGKWLYRHHTPTSAWHMAVSGARAGLAHDVGRDPFNSYASLMRAGETLGNPCEFYFMAGQKGGRHEERYDLNQPALQGLLREIHGRGHVIGLHASYNSFGSAERLCSERDCLLSSTKRADMKLKSIGGRQHYLRWENPTTWRSWEHAGFSYDATLGFPDQIGFRCGTSREFPVFDVVESKKLNLRERPLALMDVTMTEYMKLGHDEIVKQLGNLWATVKSIGGVMEVLIHNCNPQAAWLAEQVCSL